MPYGFNSDKSKYDLQNMMGDVIDKINPTKVNENRNLIFIGDSYQVGMNNNNYSFLDYFKSKYANYFGEIYRNERNGWGFAKTNNQFLTLLKDIKSQISNADKITDIIVTGCLNDIDYVDGIYQAMNDFKVYCKSTYPNATIWVNPIGWSTDGNNYNNRSKTVTTAYRWRTSGLALDMIPMDGCIELMRNPELMSNDHFHPNNNGHMEIAKCIYYTLMTGTSSTIRSTSNCGFTPNATVSSETLIIYEFVKNGILHMATGESTQITFKNIKSVVCNGKTDNAIELGTLSNSTTKGYSVYNDKSQWNGTNMNMVVTLSDKKYKNISGRLFISKGKLYVSFFGVDTPYVSGGWLTVQIKQIQFPAFDIMVNNFLG